MQRTRVKICGLRRAEDARAAIAAGADAVGVVCYPKAGRYAPLPVAIEIARIARPFASVVTLFVDQSPLEVNETAGKIGATIVQLHGVETPEQVAAIRFPVIKAVRVDPPTFARELSVWREAILAGTVRNLVGLVLETAGPGVGGTGIVNDWSFIAQVQQAGGFAGLPLVIAAGGLNPGNVGDVVRLIRPYAVDVSSGIERTRGEKAHDLIDAFAAAVRSADENLRSEIEGS